ncbi:Complement Component Receptor 1-Like Protein [Manis pentadactyla]|nr:Complement Component Receptor 1-Like Protein [Manis pentadactyla]
MGGGGAKPRNARPEALRGCPAVREQNLKSPLPTHLHVHCPGAGAAPRSHSLTTPSREGQKTPSCTWLTDTRHGLFRVGGDIRFWSQLKQQWSWETLRLAYEHPAGRTPALSN